MISSFEPLRFAPGRIIISTLPLTSDNLNHFVYLIFNFVESRQPNLELLLLAIDLALENSHICLLVGSLVKMLRWWAEIVLPLADGFVGVFQCRSALATKRIVLHASKRPLRLQARQAQSLCNGAGT